MGGWVWWCLELVSSFLFLSGLQGGRRGASYIRGLGLPMTEGEGCWVALPGEGLEVLLVRFLGVKFAKSVNRHAEEKARPA